MLESSFNDLIFDHFVRKFKCWRNHSSNFFNFRQRKFIWIHFRFRSINKFWFDLFQLKIHSCGNVSSFFFLFFCINDQTMEEQDHSFTWMMEDTTTPPGSPSWDQNDKAEEVVKYTLPYFYPESISFCSQCFYQWRKARTHYHCTICQHVNQKDPFTVGFGKNLQVDCPLRFSPVNCQWRGKLSHLLSHIKNEQRWQIISSCFNCNKECLLSLFNDLAFRIAHQDFWSHLLIILSSSNHADPDQVRFNHFADFLIEWFQLDVNHLWFDGTRDALYACIRTKHFRLMTHLLEKHQADWKNAYCVDDDIEKKTLARKQAAFDIFILNLLEEELDEEKEEEEERDEEVRIMENPPSAWRGVISSWSVCVGEWWNKRHTS